VGIGGPSGGMGGQVAFADSYLMDPPSYELVQHHKESQVEGGGVMVVPRCWEETRPLREEGLPHSFHQGRVGVID